jgi:predicted short-subunit dehydrogenase-like oxidoreductase (DUF2520 family)
MHALPINPPPLGKKLPTKIYMYFCAMTKVVIMGTGNLARQLFRALQKTGKTKVVQVVGRNPIALNYFSKSTPTGNLKGISAEADIYIVAVSDDAISSVSELITFKEKLVIHTSGSVGLKALSGPYRKGVCYPLQTFSRERNVDFREIPILIETDNTKDLVLLRELAMGLSDNVLEVSSEKRRFLHLAAIFANNFTNHLYQISNELLREEALPFSLLLPLIRETAEKLKQMEPYEAQTGPARRGDKTTMEEHLKLLDHKDHREIYTLLSNSIKHTYAEKL